MQEPIKNRLEPNVEWIKNWRLGLYPEKEKRLGHDLIAIFSAFWQTLELGKKSKKTQRRYSNSLGALGGHLFEVCINDLYEHYTDVEIIDAKKALLDQLYPDEGPLIYSEDEEEWQKEFDSVCGKLYKFLMKDQLGKS